MTGTPRDIETPEDRSSLSRVDKGTLHSPSNLVRNSRKFTKYLEDDLVRETFSLRSEVKNYIGVVGRIPTVSHS